jgi:hypothetical protein
MVRRNIPRKSPSATNHRQTWDPLPAMWIRRPQHRARPIGAGASARRLITWPRARADDRRVCVPGAASSVLAFAIGFVPPSQLGHANRVLYPLAGILVIGIVPRFLMVRFRQPAWKIAMGSQPDPRK